MTDIIKLPTGTPPGNPPGTGADALWPTATAKGIRHTIRICYTGRHIGLITGPSGIGKTTSARFAVRDILEQLPDTSFSGGIIAYLAMTQASDGLQTGLFRIARAIGAGGSPHMGANELHDAIVYSLMTGGGLLVLDEAQFMSDALLHGIRSIWDELDERGRAPGIVLLGTASLAERIEGRTSRKSREFDPLRGRLGMIYAVERLDTEDFAGICSHLGLAGAEAQNIVQRIGCGAGGLHNVRRLLGNAKRYTAADGKLGLSDLRKAAATMGVSI